MMALLKESFGAVVPFVLPRPWAVKMVLFAEGKLTVSFPDPNADKRCHTVQRAYKGQK